MILQALHALYERLIGEPQYKVAPAGYSLQNIGFSVVLKHNGELHDIIDLRIEEGARQRMRQMIVPGGDKSRGKITPASALKKAGFLRNDSAFMLGIRIENNIANVSRVEFNAFREAHLNIEKEINDPEFSIVCRFLNMWEPNPDSIGPITKKIILGVQGIFQIQGERHFVHESKAVTAWWNNKQKSRESHGERGWCLITGKKAPIALTHSPSFSILGGQSSGAMIVSFNCDAFTSYGKTPSKDKSRNAPVSEEAAFRYCTALDALLSGPLKSKHRLTIGDSTTVFWTEHQTFAEDIFGGMLSGEVTQSPQDSVLLKQIRELLHALRKGAASALEILGDDPETHFYILGLSPNSGRLSVRFWHESNLHVVLERLHSHYDALRMIRQFDESVKPPKRPDREFPPIWMLLREIKDDHQGDKPGKDESTRLGGTLMRAIMTGCPYPNALASAVLRRIHADRDINYYRAAILKAWLTRLPHSQQGAIPVSLDPDKTEPAYRLGRLFAVLEKTQQDALRIKATIRDRFYSAASATPCTVFPTLLRTYPHHLAKLNAGAKINRDRLVQEIMGALTEFPAYLNLEAQGLFAIGYYHQRKDLFTRRETQTDSGNPSA